MNFTYNHVAALQFLRTTYKAGPLLALGLACLGGYGRRAGGSRGCARRARWAPAAGLGAAAVLVALAGWPLVRGQAIDSQLTWERIPPAWESAADHVDRTVGRDGRAVVLPGQLYAYSDWGGTVDHILPALAERPGGGPLRRALRRPALGRPAVDGRRAGAAAARAARPARPAAGPAGRAHGRQRHRRRPLAAAAR